MRTKDYNFIILLICFLLTFCAIILFLNSECEFEAFADSIDNNQSVGFCDPGVQSSYCWFCDSKTYFLGENLCEIKMKVFSDSKISSLKVLSYNTDEFNFKIIEDNIVSLNFSCRDFGKYYIKIKYFLYNNEKFESSLYIVYNEYGFFYSDFSEFNAEDVFLSYLRNTQDSSEEKEENIDEERISILGNKDTYIEGRIRWIDRRNNMHNLGDAMVKAYDANSVGGDTLLGTAYTNTSGYYSITFQNNDSIFDHGGSDVYIKVYTSDGNITVKTQNGTQYEQYKWGASDVSTGSTTTINIDCQAGEDFTKAAEIFQAAITARYYAKLELGSNPGAVTIVYPYNEENRCCYNPSNSTIYITGHNNSNENLPYSYESWDVIAHEYGHHVYYDWSHIDFPGETHMFNQNYANTLGKSTAISLVWSEAWATVYGIISQNLYLYCPENIPTAKDTCYTSYNGAFYDLESTDVRLGEACEGSIISILWDLYDYNNEGNDVITLSALEWWDVTISWAAETFSEFIYHFYYEFPALKEDIGYNLSYFKIGVSDIEIIWNDTTLLPPTLSWSNDSGWNQNPFDIIMVRAYNSDDTVTEYISNGNITSCVFSQAVWNTILSWNCEQFKIKISAIHSEEPYTGTYEITKYIEKPLFRTALLSDNTLEIISPINPLEGSLYIPQYTCGKEISKIASYAFYNCTNIRYVSIANSIHTIGAHAFEGCVNLTSVYMPLSSVSRIEDYVFYNCPISELKWSVANITYIGEYSFYGCNMPSLIISDNVLNVGDYAFGNNNRTTFYTGTAALSWNTNWNSSNRPHIRLCMFDESCSYVNYFIKTNYNPNPGYNGTINNIIRSGYDFGGWYTDPDFAGNSYENIESAPNGTLYAKWIRQTSSCITEDSLITLADGTHVRVQDLNGNEDLLVWNIFTGQFDIAPILFLDSELTMDNYVLNLYFSDGTCVKVIDEHGFYDITLNRFVYIKEDNVSQYIGHMFNKQIYDVRDNMSWIPVELVNTSITYIEVSAWSPVTYGHLCYYVNDMLSMPGATEGFVNIFDIDPNNLKVCQNKMQLDIDRYGLYTYSEFTQIYDIPELIFNAFNGQYLKIAIGKGLISFEEIENLIDMYNCFFE